MIPKLLNAYDIRCAARDFERNLAKVEDRRIELAEDERSKDSLLSVLYEKVDKAMCTLRRMGLMEW